MKSVVENIWAETWPLCWSEHPRYFGLAGVFVVAFAGFFTLPPVLAAAAAPPRTMLT
jgi:hypothetical protein